jgi:uncharacterized lipoprotein YmbA
MKAAHRMTRPWLLALVSTHGLLGCSSTPATRWLSLPLPAAGAAVVQAAGPTSAAQVLIVRRVGIPEYLQTDRVRFRQAGSMLGEWPHTAWAERLELGLTDQLVMRLRLALPSWTVCERACPSQAAQAAQAPIVLNVDFAPLDYVRATGRLQAGAHWLLGSQGRQGHTVVAVAVQPDSAEGQAAALAQVLDQLASDLAATLHPGP